MLKKCLFCDKIPHLAALDQEFLSLKITHQEYGL